jgi:DNA-binding MarR family transcriptional regulator
MKQRSTRQSGSSAAKSDKPKFLDRSTEFQPDMLWVPGDLAARRDLDWTVKILVALAKSYSDNTGHGLLLDNRQLAKFLGVKPQAVLRAIRRAEAQGLIKRSGKKRRVIRASKRSVTRSGIGITRRLLSARDLDWPERALLGLIASLSKKSGSCWAS